MKLNIKGFGIFDLLNIHIIIGIHFDRKRESTFTQGKTEFAEEERQKLKWQFILQYKLKTN
tara:strand:- start:264 stop:446 length:183 start_codon:yes stop_codon:yes gene_type:complete